MLSHKMDKESRELADSANDTVDELRRAGRQTAGSAREAAMPVLDEVRSLLSQLQSTVSTLSRDGSSEAMHASRRLQERARERARMLKDRARDMTMEGAVRARSRVNHAVEDVEHRVVESPMKAVMIAAAVGAIAAMLLIGGTASAVRRNDQE